MAKMAFEINDLKGILILVLFAIPMIASMNINCSGRAFHCVNSTHFMICVDLGGGFSTTIDDFVIPCPATTVCHENNIFECDFPEVVTSPPLQVIGVYKQSDTSEQTTKTNSVTPTSDLFSVFNENITAKTLPVPEEVSSVGKLEVLENIKDPIGVNSDNATEISLKVTFSSIDSGNEYVNDKQATNKTKTTSATDNNTIFEPPVETSKYKTINTSSPDNPKSIDTVTSVIGLINLMSSDPPSAVSTKPFPNVLTTLDNLHNNNATTTEQYITKEVTISEKVRNATETVITESSAILEIVSTTPVVNTHSSNENIVKENIFFQSKNTTELVPDITTGYVASVPIVNISEPVTVVAIPQTITDKAFTALGLDDLITVDIKQSVPSTNDYINNFNSNADTTTTDQSIKIAKLETTVSEKPVTAEVKSTTPIVVQNHLKSEINNQSFPDLNSTSQITTTDNASEININHSIPELITVASLPTTTENTLVTITTEANIVNSIKPMPRALFNNDSLLENQTIVLQPSQIIIATESPPEDTNNLYQINGELIQTLITTIKTTVDISNITEKEKTLFNASSADKINEKSPDTTLTFHSTINNPAIETTTAETLQNTFSPSALQVTNESPAVENFTNVNKLNLETVKNNTLLYNTTNTLNTTEKDKTVSSASSTNIIKSKHQESTLPKPPTITYPTVEIATAKTLHNDLTSQAIDGKNELPATNAPPSVNEPTLENVGTNAMSSVLTTPANYYMSTDSVTNTTDLTAETDIVADPQTSQNKILEFLPINLAKSILQENLKTEDTSQDVIGQTTTNWGTVNQYSISATDVVKTQDVSKLIPLDADLRVSYVPEPAITTLKTVQTTPTSMDSMMIFVPSTTFTPEIVDVYRAPTLSSKIETNATYPVNGTQITLVENVTGLPVTTLPPQESTSQIISTVEYLNITKPPTKMVSNLASTTYATVLNISNWNDSVIINTVRFKVDPNDDVNKTEAGKQIENKKNDSATLSAINNKDESIKIVSAFEVINASGKAMPTGTTQQSTPNLSLSNRYIKTTASQDSATYLTVTDNVPDYTIVQVAESVTQKNLEATGALAETRIINSVSSTLSTLPIIEMSTEKLKFVGTETPILSTIDFKYTDQTKSVIDYATEKTNDYLSTQALLRQPNKLPNVQVETASSSVRSVPTVEKPDSFKIAPIFDDVTTIKDSAFIMSSTIVADSNVKTRTESPLLTSTVIEPEIIKYNKESLLLAPEVPVAQITTESTRIDTAFLQTTPMAVTSETNQDVLTEINATDLPDSVLPTVNKNKYLPIPSLSTVGVTTAQITTHPTHTNTVLYQTTQMAVAGETNQDVLTEIHTTDLPQSVPTLNKNKHLPIPSLSTVGVTTAQITTHPTPTNTMLSQTTQMAVTGETNQDVLTETNAKDLPQSVPMVNNNKYQPMPLLSTVGLTTAQITTHPTPTNTMLSQTTQMAVTGETNQDVLTETNATDLPQSVPMVNNNKYQPMPLLSTVGLTTAQITTHPTPTNTMLSQTTQMAVTGETNQDVLTETNATDLPQSVPMVNNNKYQPMPLLSTVGLTTAQITTDPTQTANIVTQTVPVVSVNKMNQNAGTETKTTSPHNVLSIVSSNNLVSALPIARETAEIIINTEPTHTTNTFAQTMPLAPADKTTQNVLSGMKTTDLPQYVISTLNNNTPLSVPSLPATRVIAAQISIEPAHATETLAQTTLLPTTGETNQDVQTGIKNTNMPQYVTTVKKSSPQPMSSLVIAKMTASQITTEPTLAIAFAQTTPHLGLAGQFEHDASGIKTTELPQYVMSAVTSNNPQPVTEITTETIIDSLTAPDSMVESINVIGDKISGTYIKETISSDVMSNNPTANKVKTDKNIIDHESIVIGTATKPVKSVNMNKAEIVNHTESYLIGSDINIDSVKIKDSGKEKEEGKEKVEGKGKEEGKEKEKRKEEEKDSKTSVTKSSTDLHKEPLASDFSIIPKVAPNDGTTVDKNEYNLTIATTNYKEAELGVPNKKPKLKPIIIKENKKAEIDSSENIKTIDVTKPQVLVDTKNISDSNKNNTNANITTSHHNLSQQNSTINDELEQHLISTNHTITTEVQSHLNESDKQSNKTSDALPLNVANMHNPNITSIKLNASSNYTDTTVPASVFNCTNHTRGKYADKNDCRKFYTCIGNLQPTLGTCPNNTVFSEINKLCTRNLSHCVRNNQFRCLFEGRFSDFFKDNIYYICVKNRIHGFIRYKLRCQVGYHLNKESVKCEKNEEISIQSASSVSETNNDESKSKTKSEKNEGADDFECENEGNFPCAKDCSKYYVCTKVNNVYRRKIKKCASDEVFNKSKKKCVESDSGEC